MADADRRLARLVSAVLVAGGCATTAPFADRGVLWRDPDEAPIASPHATDPSELWSRSVVPYLDQVDRALTIEVGREAVDANAVDEAPDSSWYTNRATPTASEILRGPLPVAAPHLPLTITSARLDDTGVRLVARDAADVDYLVRLDPAGLPLLAAGPEVVVSRLTWALGWNAPSVAPLEIAAGDLRAAPGASLRVRDDKVPLDGKTLAGLLVHAAHLANGSERVRGAATRIVDGRVLGPWSYLGRRGDDPNDRVDHEHRREVRGLEPLWAWVNRVDALDGNTLDVYVGPPFGGHVVHYQIDFGSSFGSLAARPMEAWMGHESFIPDDRVLASLATLGLVPSLRPWLTPRGEEARRARLARWPALGGFTDEEFDPARWSTLWRNPAFARATARDRFWGAKQVARIDRARLRAAIAAARYDAGSAARLEEVLWRRRDKILRWAYADVAPLDGFLVAGGALCFADRWIADGLGPARGARYRVTGELADGDFVAAGPSSCVAIRRVRGVHAVAIRVRRDGAREPGPAIRVWLADGARVVGVERDAR